MPPDGPDRLVVGVALVIAAYGALFGGAEMLRRWGVAGEQTRSLVHVMSAILALGLPALFGSPWPVVVMAMAFAATMLVSERVGLLGAIHDVPRRTLGAAMFPIGIAAAYALTGGHVPGYPIAVLALGLGDPAAAVAGRRLAHRQAAIWGARRSLEGSAVACLVSCVTTMAVLVVSGGVDRSLIVPVALAVGVSVSLAEATSPLGFDNVAIPVVAAIVMDIVLVPWRLTVLVVTLVLVTIGGLAWDRSVAAGLARRNGRLP
jgi:phytol kinase